MRRTQGGRAQEEGAQINHARTEKRGRMRLQGEEIPFLEKENLQWIMYCHGVFSFLFFSRLTHRATPPKNSKIFSHRSGPSGLSGRPQN